MNKYLIILLGFTFFTCKEKPFPKSDTTQNRVVIYQMMTRLFGNTETNNKYYGSIEENGVGKFKDINEAALKSIKEMGVTHIWYTGVLEHALMTDYSVYGIKPDDPDVVKGRAGSPYAIKDYYDVNPDLAVDVPNRMKEFEALIERSHQNGMKVLIDFVPNHVARSYHSDAKPEGVKDLGETDKFSLAFSPSNNFYYIPNKPFVVPNEYTPGGDNFKSPLKDGKFDENPAKATGNNVFSESPSLYDWFETVKLNYGEDYTDSRKEYFDPIPDTWLKMTDILLFWASKGVDGFRCDMCEMVPIAFWDYTIGRVKEKYPGILFMGEAYNQNDYKKYIREAKFDILYDKVGLYDSLKAVIQGASADLIGKAINNPNTKGIENHMLHFLENHDEQRVASPYFAGSPEKALSMMVLSATLTTGPVMIYFGQEVGAKGEGASGFSGEDGRTTIFDYWGVPEFQAWVNNHQYDGGQLTDDQKLLRNFYSNLLNIVNKEPALATGETMDLQPFYSNLEGYKSDRFYAFARFIKGSDLILALNSFELNQTTTVSFFVPESLVNTCGIKSNVEYAIKDVLDSNFNQKLKGKELIEGFSVDIPSCNSRLLKIQPLAQ